ncbi:MAG: exodeoxyribonuclease III [Verrucomicrobiota bacterium]|nr:exodeoxyribonuclease III [Verrucomicrobiota bacterium]
MKIATFNANSARSRLAAILRWLRTNKPDVLCLQETKVMDADFPVLPFTEAGYTVVFRGEKSYNGVATLSLKNPAEVSFGLDGGKSADETRLVRVKIGSVHVVNTYIPQGREIDNPMYSYKLDWFKRLKAYFDRHFTPRQTVVWLGDMNVAPESIDVHNPQDQTDHVCYHEAVRKAFADTRDWGFTDVFRKHHPEPGQYSFFDYRAIHAIEKKMGWRVDHILATTPLARKCSDAWIDIQPRLEPKPSDHTFVVAEFEM